MFSHNTLVTSTVRLCHNKQVWHPMTAKGLNPPARDPVAMTHSLLSSLAEIHRDRQYIWSTTKHNSTIWKSVLPATGPPEIEAEHSGTWSLANCLFFFPSSLFSRFVGSGLLRLELCLFSSAPPMCGVGQREMLTGIFQRVTSVWLAGCHQGNVRPVSAVSGRAAAVRLIGADGLLFWERQI